MNPAFWRRWHRWIAFPAALFLLFAAITGVITAMTEFFGEAEALREATRNMASPVRTDSGAAAWQQPLALALARAATDAPGAPIDRIQIQFKGPQPTVDVFLGKPGGGEDRRLVLDAEARCAPTPTPTSRTSPHPQRRSVRRRRSRRRDAVGHGARLPHRVRLHHLRDDETKEPDGRAARVLVERQPVGVRRTAETDSAGSGRL